MSFRAWKSWFFWALQCFVRFRPRNTAMLKFCEPWGCEMLVFWWALQCFVRFKPRNTVMLKKFQNFQTWNSRNTVMLKKFQKFQNSGIYGQAGGRFLKILEFFEHYSVSWVSGLGKVDLFWALHCFVRFKPRNTAMLKFCELWGCETLEFFEHYSVLWGSGHETL